MTYCLIGNGLTIVADEEYLTISSTLETPPSLPSNNTPTTNPDALDSQTSNSFKAPNLNPHVPTTTLPALTFLSDNPTPSPLNHPPQPLTTQPPKNKHHPIQQGLLPSRSKATSKNFQPSVPPSQPLPLTPITAQVISSVPPCAGAPAPTLPTSVLPSPAQMPPQLREELQRKLREFDDDDDDDLDEEEKESRRKAS